MILHSKNRQNGAGVSYDEIVRTLMLIRRRPPETRTETAASRIAFRLGKRRPAPKRRRPEQFRMSRHGSFLFGTALMIAEAMSNMALRAIVTAAVVFFAHHRASIRHS